MKAAITAIVRSVRVRLREWVRPEGPWSIEEELFNMGRKR